MNDFESALRVGSLYGIVVAFTELIRSSQASQLLFTAARVAERATADRSATRPILGSCERARPVPCS